MFSYREGSILHGQCCSVFDPLPPFPCHTQVHSYLPSNEGSDSVHSVPGQADHCRGLDVYLHILHAVVFPGGHSGERIRFALAFGFCLNWPQLILNYCNNNNFI